MRLERPYQFDVLVVVAFNLVARMAKNYPRVEEVKREAPHRFHSIVHD